MATNERTINASPETVWEVLSDGWLYPVWVVGATRMRDVDPHWPGVGAKLHHSVGVWPAALNDDTEVIAVEERRRLQLLAKGWPLLGEAEVVLELEPAADGTLVRIIEEPVRGPGTLLPAAVVSPMLKWRNVETLRRLGFVAEGRSQG